MLDDGSYDTFVVDVTVTEAGDASTPRTTVLELTVVSGPRKGEVVEVTASGLAGEEFELIGMPATLVVDGGVPTVRIDGV